MTKIFVENVRVSDNEPRQRAGIFLGVRAGVGFDSVVGRRRTILNQLLRHGTQAGRCHERLADTAHTWRNWPVAVGMNR